MSRVVVIGATGHIGTYLVPRLVDGGHQVIAVSRGTRYVPMCPVAPMTTTRLIRTRPFAASPRPRHPRTEAGLSPAATRQLSAA